MRCDFCNTKEATLVICFANARGHSQKRLFVCQTCAEQLSLSHLVDKKGVMHTLSQEVKTEKEHVCSWCGLSIEEARRTNSVGCPSCYRNFIREFEEWIGQYQLGNVHRGKVPLRWARVRKIRERVEKMVRELKKCIAEENYERAEQIKNFILRLQARLP